MYELEEPPINLKINMEEGLDEEELKKWKVGFKTNIDQLKSILKDPVPGSYIQPEFNGF